MSSDLTAGQEFEFNRHPDATQHLRFADEVYLVDSTIRSLQSTVSGSRHRAADLVEIGLALDRIGVRELIVNAGWKDGIDVIAGLAATRPAAKVVATFRVRSAQADALLKASVEAGADEVCIESAPDARTLAEKCEDLRAAGVAVSHAFAERYSWDEIRELSRAASRLQLASLSFHDSFFRFSVTPEGMRAFIGQVREEVPGHPPLYVHLSNFYGSATMTAVAAVTAGASAVDVCLNQSGHHCGHTSLAEVAVILESLYGLRTGIDLSRVKETVELVSVRTGIPVRLTQPLIGDLAFMIDGADWAEEAELAEHERMHSALPVEPGALGGVETRVWSERTTTAAGMTQKLKSLGLPSDAQAAARALRMLSSAQGERTSYPYFLRDKELDLLMREQAQTARHGLEERAVPKEPG